jgi:histidine triad (HIT) family protein
MEDSIFTKIIKGEIPCHKIYEDEKTIAFMDINPVQPGMVVVATKVQVENFFSLEDDDFTAVMRTAKLVARKLHEVFPTKKRIAMQVEGLDVPHVHIKIFPIDAPADFRAQPPRGEPDHAALAEIAKQLAF